MKVNSVTSHTRMRKHVTPIWTGSSPTFSMASSRIHSLHRSHPATNSSSVTSPLKFGSQKAKNWSCCRGPSEICILAKSWRISDSQREPLRSRSSALNISRASKTFFFVGPFTEREVVPSDSRIRFACLRSSCSQRSSRARSALRTLQATCLRELYLAVMTTMRTMRAVPYGRYFVGFRTEARTTHAMMTPKHVRTANQCRARIKRKTSPRARRSWWKHPRGVCVRPQVASSQ
mmetsp:Transcript_62099/g.110657  ORF Transcript_62099/g.110657 Transcript_62099/m.110657 type:complete len:233 (+) Transcript_62099:319-1017(+)